jgi:ribosomal protein S12 methylthiotransferase accessory factor
VPAEVVHTDYTVPWAPGSGSFLCTTNGLASGNTMAEALLHAVCETIERDALALWEAADGDARDARRLDLATVADPAARTLLGVFTAAGVAVVAWDVTSDVRVPVVRVIVLDTDTDPALAPSPASFGSGCHPDPDVALLRALTEAAQSRLTAIAGSRDDLVRNVYRTTSDPEVVADHRAALARPAPRDAGHLPGFRGETVDDDVVHVVGALAAAGFAQVLAVPMDARGLPVAVVRAVVPGLEGATESSSYLAGPRARNVRGW